MLQKPLLTFQIPSIDKMSETGEKLSKLRGDIQLQHAQFTYPARPDKKVSRKDT